MIQGQCHHPHEFSFFVLGMADLPPPVRSLPGRGAQSPVQGPSCPFELGWGAVPIFRAQCYVIIDVLVLRDS